MKDGGQSVQPMDVRQARTMVGRLQKTLEGIVAKDQEQEVRGIALPVLDAVVAAAREWVTPGDPILDRFPGIISAETIAEGEPLRAVDVLLAVEQLKLALDRAMPPRTSRWSRP